MGAEICLSPLTPMENPYPRTCSFQLTATSKPQTKAKSVRKEAQMGRISKKVKKGTAKSELMCYLVKMGCPSLG
jgi:hypothetical protein